jgi:spermidine synthase
MKPWQIVARAVTDEGELELRQRGGDFLMTISGRVLMTSMARRSEEELARVACAALRRRERAPSPRVLVAGLGMGFTLRAALDTLPPAAAVVVAELSPAVARWCRAPGPLAPLSGAALEDPRVTLHLGDVAALIRGSPPGSFDAIVLDLYEGPNAATQRADDPFYGRAALAATRAALRAPGVLAVWSEDPDPAFEERLGGAGFRVAVHKKGGGGRAHTIYVATGGPPLRRGRGT